jgi:hypothetical protein
VVEPPPSVVPPTGENGYNTYISALEDIIAHQLVEREDTLTVNTNATPTITMANIMAEMKKELTAMIAGMAANTSGPGGGGAGEGGEDGGGRRRRKNKYGKDADRKDLPKCPHCGKPATHKADDCFSLPKNEEKMKAAGFVDGKFMKKVE